jgi:hypothetical protein
MDLEAARAERDLEARRRERVVAGPVRGDRGAGVGGWEWFWRRLGALLRRR